MPGGFTFQPVTRDAVGTNFEDSLTKNLEENLGNSLLAISAML
jgi:hypothetical protein